LEIAVVPANQPSGDLAAKVYDQLAHRLAARSQLDVHAQRLNESQQEVEARRPPASLELAHERSVDPDDVCKLLLSEAQLSAALAHRLSQLICGSDDHLRSIGDITPRIGLNVID